METKFHAIANGEAIGRDDIPQLSVAEFRDAALALVAAGGKVVQLFGTAVVDESLPTIAVLRLDDQLWVASTQLPKSYASLTAEAEPFHLFERELAEQFGVTPEDHPWLRMVRYHPNYADRPDVFGNDYSVDIPGNYPYYAVGGEEIHEVAVGPVHAGVIEPGHFRFNCIGERVLNLEISLGYQHRGIERMLPSAPAGRRQLLVETIAGDTTAGHSLCHAQAMEALTDSTVGQPDRMVRSAALELERLANHTGDLGALSGDVAFLPPANYFGRMRGDLLNMTMWLCGNRFSRGLVVPGGVGVTLEPVDFETVLGRLTELRPQLEHVIDLLFGASTVRARFDGCGRVSQKDAEHLGLVGPAGRACGLDYDVRRVFPTEHYGQMDVDACQPFEGDVFARARIRADEILASITLLEALLPEMTATQATAPMTEALSLAPSSLVVTLNEAWRGEVSHCVLTDTQGEIERYKVKDPSFHNWNGLAMSLRDTGISDFPLNNKSFNLSYCGHDL